MHFIPGCTGTFAKTKDQEFYNTMLKASDEAHNKMDKFLFDIVEARVKKSDHHRDLLLATARQQIFIKYDATSAYTHDFGFNRIRH